MSRIACSIALSADLSYGVTMNGACLGVVHRRELRERGRAAVVVDQDLLEELRVRPAGADGREVLLRSLDGAVHARSGIGQDIRDHCVSLREEGVPSLVGADLLRS